MFLSKDMQITVLILVDTQKTVYRAFLNEYKDEEVAFKHTNIFMRNLISLASPSADTEGGL